MTPFSSDGRLGKASGLYLHCWLDGQACRALVDTGATISLVWPGVLHNTGGPQLPGAWTPTTTPLTSVTRAKMAMRGKKEVTVSGQEVLHEFWLADIADSCIIGLDLLNHWGACVDVSRASITLGAETVALQSVPQPDHSLAHHHQPATQQPPAQPKPALPAETTAAVHALWQRSSSGLDHQQLKSLLDGNADLFAVWDEDCTQTELVQHTINTDTAQPIRLRPHRMSPAKRLVAEEKVKEMAAADDLLVHASDFQQALANLTDVLAAIRQAGLRLNPKKCQLLRRETAFLGHIVSERGVATDPSKVADVRDWPVPGDVGELRSFLGLASYYRRFVRDFATLASPLHRLTDKCRPFVWQEGQSMAFDQLRAALTEAPVLAYPDAQRPFIIDTDASNTGVGAVLSQKDEDGERVVAYYSRALGKAERNYCVTRRELLAVVRALHHFRPYLHGSHFLLRTNHASLTWLLNFKDPEGQVARWLEQLQGYDFEIRHRAGRLHGNADALSRRPCAAQECRYCSHQEERDQVSPDVAVVQASGNAEEVAAADAHGAARGRQHAGQESPELKSYYSLYSNLVQRNGLLYRRWQAPGRGSDILQLLVPQALHPDVLSGRRRSLYQTRVRRRWRKGSWRKCSPRFGSPAELHSDQGCNFESQVLAEVCKRLGVTKTRTTPLHPQSDGLVERFNRTLATQLAILASQHQRDWDRHLPLVLWAYRSAVQESSQLTPAALMFGRELRTPVDLVFGAPPEPEEPSRTREEYYNRLRDRLLVTHDFARKAQVVYRIRMPGRGRLVVLHQDRLAPYRPLATPDAAEPEVSSDSALPSEPEPSDTPLSATRRPKRHRRPPGHFWDFDVSCGWTAGSSETCDPLGGGNVAAWGLSTGQLGPRYRYPVAM
ncbi:hypothetical protein SKAU_G00281240 [Synaphobranchus kaupii]|uniref:Integrase catalytic domain-containing protein n=1 Tax=Synaphobranchus kaupii TaxID=118154 RepID=A0A9Q1EX95_SYNKA|nr:hypothetical protein SKAU_G00281240 [Synaphobranchus kaupii]